MLIMFIYVLVTFHKIPLFPELQIYQIMFE